MYMNRKRIQCLNNFDSIQMDIILWLTYFHHRLDKDRGLCTLDHTKVTILLYHSPCTTYMGNNLSAYKPCMASSIFPAIVNRKEKCKTWMAGRLYIMYKIIWHAFSVSGKVQSSLWHFVEQLESQLQKWQMFPQRQRQRLLLVFAPSLPSSEFLKKKRVSFAME